MESGQFTCSICGDASRDICVYCTKDACANHICERCHRCSDCCECDAPRGQSTPENAETVFGDAGPEPVAGTDSPDRERDFQPV